MANSLVRDKIKEGMKKLKERRDRGEKIPFTEPRYDSVYYEGVKWLDSLMDLDHGQEPEDLEK